MTRVLMIYDGMISTVELLGNFMAEVSERKGFRLKKLLTTQVTAGDILECDVVLCVRGDSPLMCELLKQARAAGRFVIFYLDDDLQHLPKNSFSYPRRKKYLRDALACADFFLTSNQLLLEEYLPLIAGKGGAVMEWSVDASQIQPRVSKAEDSVVRIVYAGASSHASNWDRFFAPIWPAITKKYGDRISMTFVGMHPTVKETDSGTTVEFIPSMKLADYRQFMYSSHFDIGLSPLVTNHFTERKSFIKFLEYSMCGICGIYSACPPYTLVVRDGINGILADNDPRDWQQALERAIENRQLRERCIDNAQQQLWDVFTAEKVRERLLMDVPELASYRAPEGQSITISAAAVSRHKLFRIAERVYLTGLSLKMYGPRKTLDRIRRKIGK